MGHERVGTLPRSQRWERVVADMAALAEGPNLQAADIARTTLDNVRARYSHIHSDAGVQAAFHFLVALATDRFRRDSARDVLGISLDDDPSPVRLAARLNTWIADNADNAEYAELARRAGGDAILRWTRLRTTQPSLFSGPPSARETWDSAATAGGFCTVSRLFFAAFTDRYLRYFLDRASSAAIDDPQVRDSFSQSLRTHVETVSRHAYETAEIMQSFAAGWFAKYVRDTDPPKEEIQRFLRRSFGKLQEELLREADRT